MLKTLLNRPEQVTYNRLAAVCQRRCAEVFAKVRLADVLPIESSGIPVDLYRFALQSHFDFVVTDNQKRPLFAVEFDGPQHDDLEQVKRDLQKDELSTQFALPLLRVRDAHLYRDERQLDRLTELAEQWFDDRERCQVEERRIPVPSCPLCGDVMFEKMGRYGPFLSCTRFSVCKGTCDLPMRPVPSWSEALSVSSNGTSSHAHGLAMPTNRSAESTSANLKIGLFSAVVFGLFASFIAVMLLLRPAPIQPIAPPTASPVIAISEPVQIPIATPPQPAPARANKTKKGPQGAAATPSQMSYLASLVRRKGWSDDERETEIARVLKHKANYTELTKQDASKLIDAWEDKNK